MYTRSQPLVAKASASMVPNNLSVRSNPSTGGSDVLVLHKSVAHVLFSSPEPGCYTDQHVVCKVPSANQQTSFVMILQASWITVAKRDLLVLATQKGIQVYEWDASSLVFWHGFGSGGDAILFTRGIGTIGDNTFCVGTSAGQILVFNVPSKGGNITFEEYLPGHNHPITVVIGYGDNLVSGDENGDIVVRKYFDDGSFRVKHTIKGSGSPCNCIDVWKSIIVAGYGSGLLKIYDVNEGTLLGEIKAHARSVNALHIAQGSGMCVSASEDSYIRIWEFSVDGSVEVRHTFADAIEDHQLVGARFTDDKGRSLAVAAYDSSEIFVFQRS